MHSVARCLLYILSPPMLIYFFSSGFSPLGALPQQSAIDPFLPDKKAADKRESHSHSHKGESFAC